MVGHAEGLSVVPARDITGTKAKPVLLNSDPSLLGAREILVTQTEKILSLFAINGEGELAFLTTSCEELSKARAAPIMPSGLIKSFSAMVTGAQDKARHSLICNDGSGNLIQLVQALDTGIWRQEPFFVETGGELVEFNSYTVIVTPQDAQENPLPGGALKLQTESTLAVIINGRSTFLTPEPTWHKLDMCGELGILIPTTSMGCQPINVEGLRDVEQKAIDLGPLRIDPISKVMQRLSNVTSVEQLREAKTADGKSLWEGKPPPSDTDLQQASQCFTAVRAACAALPSNGSIAPSVGISLAQDKPQDMFMDAFIWISKKAIEVKDWIVRKSGRCCTHPVIALTRQARSGSLCVRSAPLPGASCLTVSKRSPRLHPG